MKKSLFVLLALLVLSVFAHGQLFVGGSFNYNTKGGTMKNIPESGSTTTVDLEKVTEFAFNPQVGMFMADNLAVGVGLIYESLSTSDGDNKDSETSIGLAPFARYYFADFNKFRMFATATLAISSGSSKETSSGTTIEGPKSSVISLNLAPTVSYSLTKNIELEVGLHFMDVGYTSTTYKEEYSSGKNTARMNELNFGFNSNNVLTAAFATVGMIYKL
ncbi:MAG: hypothetical protein JXR50_10695 [Prolixibacteraceae bacterium]|nr:hypothetical protein [Prolixibacteraceae bacterium]MBN2650194.1 hypothetical protein [Prolixibacteraceae bacterium]